MKVTNRNKVAIAVITAFGSVAAATVGVLPEVWPGTGRTTETPAPSWSVEGEIVGAFSPEPVKAEVFLMRASGSELVTVTDDGGRFVFDNVPVGRYWILVRASESQSRSCGRGLIDEIGVASSASELSVSGAQVRYAIVEPNLGATEGS